MEFAHFLFRVCVVVDEGAQLHADVFDTLVIVVGSLDVGVETVLLELIVEAATGFSEEMALFAVEPAAELSLDFDD